MSEQVLQHDRGFATSLLPTLFQGGKIGIEPTFAAKSSRVLGKCDSSGVLAHGVAADVQLPGDANTTSALLGELDHLRVREPGA